MRTQRLPPQRREAEATVPDDERDACRNLEEHDCEQSAEDDPLDAEAAGEDHGQHDVQRCLGDGHEGGGPVTSRSHQHGPPRLGEGKHRLASGEDGEHVPRVAEPFADPHRDAVVAEHAEHDRCRYADEQGGAAAADDDARQARTTGPAGSEEAYGEYNLDRDEVRRRAGVASLAATAYTAAARTPSATPTTTRSTRWITTRARSRPRNQPERRAVIRAHCGRSARATAASGRDRAQQLPAHRLHQHRDGGAHGGDRDEPTAAEHDGGTRCGGEDNPYHVRR